MPTALNPITLPDQIPDRNAAKVASEYRRLTDEALKEIQRLDDLEQRQFPAAEQADREAIAAAIRAGKPEPDAKESGRVLEEIAASRRRAESFEIAVSGTYDDLLTAVDAARPAWREKLNEQIVALRADLRDAIDAVAEPHAELAAALGARTWLEDFPNVGGGTIKPRANLVPTLKGPNSELVTVADALDGLRRLTVEPEPSGAGSVGRPVD